MKAHKKQSKKAVTLLTQIEKLLTGVLKECSALEITVEKSFRQLLHTAEVSIAAAKEFVTPGPPPPGPPRKVHHRTVARRAAPRAAAKARKRPIARAA